MLKTKGKMSDNSQKNKQTLSNLYYRNLTDFENDLIELNVRLHTMCIKVHLWTTCLDKNYDNLSVARLENNYHIMFSSVNFADIKRYYDDLLRESTITKYCDLVTHFEDYLKEGTMERAPSDDKLVYRFISLNIEIQDGCYMLRKLMCYIDIFKTINSHCKNVFDPMLEMFILQKNIHYYHLGALSHRFMKNTWPQSICMSQKRLLPLYNDFPLYNDEDFALLLWKIQSS